MEPAARRSDFVHVNGIKLHYLDWGGKGDAMIFLSGTGCSAHLYDHIAPRFGDRFRVLALTRRGQGASDYPESGYDADSLNDDILDFMDALELHQAALIGHSLAALAYWKTAWLPWRERNFQKLKMDLPRSRIIEIPNGHHYCFIAQEELVYEEMRKFLLH
jgi:pimeloyl-ACP methyl ester carboxylesterase